MAARGRGWRSCRAALALALALGSAPIAAITCGAAGGDNRPAGECPLDEQAEPASPAGDAPASATAQAIDLVTGNKYLRHVDLAWPGGLIFARHYNSRHAFATSLGPGWRHAWETRIVDRGALGLLVLQGDGRRRMFRPVPGTAVASAWDSVDPLAGRIHRRAGAVGEPGGWLWRLPDGAEFAFDASGRLQVLRRPEGDRVELHHNPHSGLLDSIRGAHGQRLHLHHDAAGRLVSLEHPDGGLTRYRYGARGLLVSVERPDGSVLRYHYDDDISGHALTRVRGAGEADGDFAYDDQGRAVASRLLGQPGVRLVFQPPVSPGATGLTEVHHETRGVSRYRWRYLAGEHRSMILEASGPGCPVCPPVGYRATYDRLGRILALRADHAGRVLRWHRDAAGRVMRLSAWHPGAGATVSSWERQLSYAGTTLDAPLSGYRESSVAPGRHRALRILRDARGLPIETAYHGWAPDLGSLDAAARPTRWLPIVRRLRYGWTPSSPTDEPVRLAWIDGPLPGEVDRIQLHHDSLGRLRSIAWPEGLREERHFDAIGRLRGWREASGAITVVERDVRGVAMAVVRDAQRLVLPDPRQTGVARPASGAIPGGAPAADPAWSGPPSHGLEILTDPLGARTLRWHDDFGDVVAESSPLRGLVVHRRDAAGRTIVRAHETGVIERIAYDALGRVIARVDGDGAAGTRLRWTGPHLAGIADPVRRVAWTRDPQGRVLLEAVVIGSTAGSGVGIAPLRGPPAAAEGPAPVMVSTFARDAHGRVIVEQLPGGHRLDVTRDAQGLERAVVFTAADGRRLALAEDIAWTGRPAAPNMVGARAAPGLSGWRTGERLRVRIHRDTAGREVGLDADDRMGPVVRRQLRRDALGRIVAIDDLDGHRERFVYDTAGRLVGAAGPLGVEGFAYDANGNRIVRWFRDARPGAAARVERLQHDRDGRLLTVSADGQPTRHGARSADGTWGLVLAVASGPDAGSGRIEGVLRGPHGRPMARFAEDRLLAAYDHDASGLRVRRRDGPRPDQTSLFLHRDGLLVGEADHRGRLRRWIVRIGLRPVAELRFAAGRFAGARWLVADQRGSPLIALDDTGRVRWRATPSAFAGHGAMPGIAVDDPDPALRYAGHWADPGGAHVENGWRSYLPHLGRYAEPDPLGPLAGPNERAYAGSDPIGRIDPFGLYELDVHYHLSFFLARTAGASPQRAHMVALAAQYVDDNPLTRPESAGNFAARSLYHFVMAGYDRSSDPATRFHDPRSPQLDRLLAAAHSPRASACARLVFFGEFLHTFQDSFAHRDHDNQPFRSQDGHLLAGHDPDQTYDVINAASPPGSALRAFADYRWNEARTLRMAQESWEQMRRFFGLRPPVGFEALQDTVRRFAQTGAERNARWISTSRRPETQGEYTLRKLAELRDKVRVLGEVLHDHGLGGFDTLYADGEGELFQARYRAQAGAAQRERYLAGLDHGRGGEPDPFPGILLPGD
jgi:RHS repeat-associated protein